MSAEALAQMFSKEELEAALKEITLRSETNE